MQAISHKLSPDQAAAGLALATHISQSLATGSHPGQPMPQIAPPQPPQAPQAGQEAQQPEPFDNTHNEAKMKDLESAMKIMQSDIEAKMKDEISGIKDLIIQALHDDGQTN